MTSLSWDLLYSSTGLPKPLVVNIPAYTRLEMLGTLLIRS